MFFSCRKAFVLTGWSANIISRPSLSKNNQRGNSNFWPKSWFNPWKKKSSMATMWNPYCYSPGGLVFLSSWSIYLVTCWLHDLLTYLLNRDIDMLTEYLSELLTWLYLLHVTEWMTCLDCMALGGLHDCGSLFLVLFTVNFMMDPKSALHCANCKRSGY